MHYGTVCTVQGCQAESSAARQRTAPVHPNKRQIRGGRSFERWSTQEDAELLDVVTTAQVLAFMKRWNRSKDAALVRRRKLRAAARRELRDGGA